VPLSAVFRDQTGREVRIAGMLGGRPTILALGYFHCPNLCGIVRADLIDALRGSGLSAAGDYNLLVLSIDPSETPTDARRAAEQDAARLGSSAVPANWHYLAGDAEQIQSVEQQVGFRARFNPALKQFLHPAGLVFLAPRGTVSSYVLGVGYEPGDVRLALTRAREGTVSAVASPILLLCFHYDATTGRYTLAITKVLQLAGVLTMLIVGGAIGIALRRERRS
jgi:protein SCO1/2